ncbi:MAG: hypothetical protein OdinLCB4_000055 [Candidatus Odinarchaeum yellowstonii]|uniref:Uncharacterized protein n=1 Tax=Odinarchaeota yellowstonii (strain LCB_4) TaxID=1841599 RepID=A0AAF0D283_ODILC|nr:MAG: hypothetical protein OdinLCB4_000055 [Candidatus Odinarchaeum yellowstonii]
MTACFYRVAKTSFEVKSYFKVSKLKVVFNHLVHDSSNLFSNYSKFIFKKLNVKNEKWRL